MKNLVITILTILVLCMGVYIAVDKINDNKKIMKQDASANEEKLDQEIDTTDKQDKTEIDIQELSIDSFKIVENGPNNHLYINGKIKISFDESKYIVTLFGYCLGADGEKYKMHGPTTGAISYHNDDTELYLGDDIPQNIVYPDGTEKQYGDVEWNKVQIKSCKIDKMKAYFKDSIGTIPTIETELNYEKNF